MGLGIWWFSNKKLMLYLGYENRKRWKKENLQSNFFTWHFILFPSMIKLNSIKLYPLNMQSLTKCHLYQKRTNKKQHEPYQKWNW